MIRIIFLASFLAFSLCAYADEEIIKAPQPSTLSKKVPIFEVEKMNYTIPNALSTNVDIAKNLFQIAFFISMVLIALFSYIQAKKTIFSPIKTEIFKYQLQAFEKVISHFQNKSEFELKKEIDMDTIIEINSFDLFKSYINTFMKNEIEINEEMADKMKGLAKGAIMTQEYAEKYLKHIGTKPPVIPDHEDPNNPALKLAKWNNRKYGQILFTEKYSKATDEIKSFQNSPLLPTELKRLLRDYNDLMRKSLSTVGDAVKEAGKDMPTEFPTETTLKNFSSGWISYIHNRKTPELTPKATEILNFINKYLDIDNLVKKNV